MYYKKVTIIHLDFGIVYKKKSSEDDFINVLYFRYKLLTSF